LRNLRDHLARGERAFGSMVFEFFVPGLAQLAVTAGADFLVYDMEHSGAGIDTIKAQMAFARGLPLTPIVRVPSGDYHFIARVLDCGAKGIMVPMVETGEQAAAFVSAAKYPPQGRRGAAFGVAHDDYAAGPVRDKIAKANAETLLIALVETARGADNVDAIAATPGIDVVWLGHFDLTNSLGIPEQFDHPLYAEAVAKIVGAARRNGKAAGFMAMNDDWARDYLGRGFSMLAYGLDHALYQRSLTDGIASMRRL
jgi:2-dehydro-3-deoxyglucarate aldolase/4-hydroxy-2-oxoheptanedioate aldolase